MKLRLARPAPLVDIGRLATCAASATPVTTSPSAGSPATTTQRVPLLRQHCPLIAYGRGLVGDPQVRHRGTIGGSLAHGDPASDLPYRRPRARRRDRRPRPGRERTIAAKTSTPASSRPRSSPDEIIIEVRVPKIGSAGWSYVKFTAAGPTGRPWAWPRWSALERLRGQERGVALTNMGATSLASEDRRWEDGDRRRLHPSQARSRIADEGTEPPSDHAASSEFRRHLGARPHAARARRAGSSLRAGTPRPPPAGRPRPTRHFSYG